MSPSASGHGKWHTQHLQKGRERGRLLQSPLLSDSIRLDAANQITAWDDRRWQTKLAAGGIGDKIERRVSVGEPVVENGAQRRG